MTTPLIWITAISFLGYGMSCVFTTHMVAEFERYQLARFRVMTGVLQLLGAIGLLIGLCIPLIGLFASGGLALQMLLAFGVRIKIKDSIFLTAPSLMFMGISALLFLKFYQSLT